MPVLVVAPPPPVPVDVVVEPPPLPVELEPPPVPVAVDVAPPEPLAPVPTPLVASSPEQAARIQKIELNAAMRMRRSYAIAPASSRRTVGRWIGALAGNLAGGYSGRMSDAIEAMASNLAHNLRYIRQRRSLTQQQLAKLSGVPRSTVGQIETGSCNPTLSVLARVATSLQISIEELISTPRARCEVFRKGSLPELARGRGGLAKVHRLLPHPVPGMEIDRLELLPKARFTGVPHRPGTREYLSCERGQLTFWAAGEKHTLAPGDVAAFQGDQAHSYQNDGDVVAVGFSVVALAPMPGPG